jgi:hypothetical protein
MEPREHIEESKLSEKQRNYLQQVRNANLKAALDAVLRERGIRLQMYGLQLAELNGGGGPPPGGCYCCAGGVWYCC